MDALVENGECSGVSRQAPLAEIMCMAIPTPSVTTHRVNSACRDLPATDWPPPNRPGARHGGREVRRHPQIDFLLQSWRTHQGYHPSSATSRLASSKTVTIARRRPPDQHRPRKPVNSDTAEMGPVRDIAYRE